MTPCRCLFALALLIGLRSACLAAGSSVAALPSAGCALHSPINSANVNMRQHGVMTPT